MTRVKIPKQFSHRIEEYLRSSLPSKTGERSEISNIMDTLCQKVRHLDPHDEIRIRRVLSSLAVGHVRKAHSAWRDGVSGEVPAAFLMLRLLGKLDAATLDAKRHVIEKAVRVMGPEQAEILLLRHDMGFDAGCDGDRVVEPYTDGGMVWSHPSRFILPCPSCLGVNHFTNKEIALTVSKGRSTPLDPRGAASSLRAARIVWVEILSGDL